MESLREIAKGMLVFGLLMILAAGAILLAGPKLPLRIGRLPGDIVYHGRHTTFYFPIVTSLVVSAVLTLLFWMIGSFRK